ncbi:hypothetical protein [Ruminococcus callidus]|uniref:hypothetical protein n=1 Tax=Ruminococcus callidus TaxID=40519 RepID=UPI00351F8EF1
MKIYGNTAQSLCSIAIKNGMTFSVMPFRIFCEVVFRQYRTKIVRQMRRQIFRQMKQKAE